MTINVIVCKKFARQQLQILPSVYFVRSVIDDLLLLLFIKEHKKAHKRGKLNLKSSKELGFYTKVLSSREGFFLIMFVLLYITHSLEPFIKKDLERRHIEHVRFLFLPKMDLLGNQVSYTYQ